MKKLILCLAVLLAFLAVGAPAQAADRVTKIVKTCKYTVTTAANASADAVLAKSDGTGNWCDVSDMSVERIQLEDNVTALTGTNVIFKVITTSDPTNEGATTDAALVGSDGSTAFVSATITGAGRHAKGTQVPGTGGSGLNSNLGTKVGVWADVSSLSVLDGYVWLTIFGKL